MKPLYILILLSILSACNKKENAVFKEAVVSSEVAKMLDEYHAAIKENGLMAEFKYLDNSSDFFWVPPGYSSALSFDSVKHILETNSKAFRSVEFNWDTLQIFPLSNEIANYTGIVSSLMIDTTGIQSTFSIIESGTVIKRGNDWKLLSGQSAILNSDSSN